MELEWGYPHAFALLSVTTLGVSWFVEWRAERRRRNDTSAESYTERYHRRRALAQRASTNPSERS